MISEIRPILVLIFKLWILQKLLEACLLIYSTLHFVPATSAKPPQTTAQSIKSLEQTYIQLKNQLETSQNSQFFNFAQTERRQQTLQQQIHQVAVQLLIEKMANDNWKQALVLGAKAAKLGHQKQPSLAIVQQRHFLWQQAIHNLSEIPDHSLLSNQANQKIQQYQKNLGQANQELQISQALFLQDVAKQSGLSPQVKITVCHISKRCMHLRGNEPPVSAASLMKLPVAVALVHKLSTQNISLEKPVNLDPSNFTEDSIQIKVNQKYPLKELMFKMIEYSSNITTNQLIDYLKRPYINQVLEKYGHQKTRIYSKLKTARLIPKDYRIKNQDNVITSNEITQMMVQIYNHEIPHSDILIKSLNKQYYRDLGYTALQKMPVKWLGEKTGENSQVIGTTVALEIRGEKYFITIIDLHQRSYQPIRQVVMKITEHFLQGGQL